MKSRSLTFRILRSIGIVIVIFIASVFIINLSIFDEELKPEVLSLLEPVDNTLAQGNAYIAFWGITSNSSQDYYDSGLKLMKQYRKIKLEDHQAELSKVDLEEILGPDHLDKDWLNKYESCRARDQYGCLEKTSQFLKLNPVTNQRLLLMQERFVEILKMRNYQHIMEIYAATPLPPFGTVMRLSQIKLSEAYNTQDKINFIIQLREDLKFWRMVLGQSDTLLDKMVALAAIWKDYQYLSEYLSIHTLNEQEKNSVANLLENLSRNELNMRWVFESETRMLLKGIHMMDSELDMSEHFDFNSGITNNLWQKNATLNQTYENTFLPLACLSKLSGADFYSYIVEKNTSNCDFLENPGMGWFSLSNLYNPGGKILASIAVPAYSDYIARIHDLNGIISLVKLQLSLKLSGNQLLENAIKNSAIRNPYTGEPMDYDQEEGWLSFECLDTSSSCRIKL